MKIQKTKNPFDRFAELIQNGVKCWIEAGKILNEIIAEDSEAKVKLMEYHPWLTWDIIAAFQRIGRRELMPALMLDSSPGAQKLSELPYSLQESLYGKEIEIYTQDDYMRISKVSRKIGSLTRRDIKIAFDENGLRPIDEQLPLAKKLYRKIEFGGTHVLSKPVKVKSDEEDQAAEKEEQDYNFDDIPPEDLDAPAAPESASIDECLRKAQQEILRARHFIQERDDAEKIDGYLANALRPIGTLRYLLGGNEA